MSIKTTDEHNRKIITLLKAHNTPLTLSAAACIEELEAQREALLEHIKYLYTESAQ